MKIAICDDEMFFAQKLKALLQNFVKLEKIAADIYVFTDPNEFLKSEISSYNAVFLDVMIGGTNGMDVAVTLRKANKEALLIFVSAFVEYAPKGFVVNAFRYLLKADLEESLTPCMRDVLERKKEQQRTFHLKTTEGCTKTIKLFEILYFESFAHNVIVHVSNPIISQYKMYDALSEINKQLPKSDFFRVQRSYIVNLRNATEMKGDKLYLPNDKIITCSRQVREDVLKRFLEIQGE